MRTVIVDAKKHFEYAVDCAARLIAGGGVAALPTETVYGLGASAFDPAAVRQVFEAKGRPADNPLIVHVSDIDMLSLAATDVPGCAYALMEAFWPGPLSLVLPKRPAVPDEVTCGLDTVAVRMPSHPVMCAVIARAGRPIAAPSANTSGRVSPTLASHVYEDLNGKIPLIVDGGACEVGLESTVLDVTGKTPVILRPGLVTKEMVRRVTGEVDVHPGLGQEAGAPPSPGMKYRHYAPRARVHFFEGDKLKVAQKIVSLYYLSNENALVLCPDNCLPLYAGLNCQGMGFTESGAGAALFSRLRSADEAGYGRIYFHYAEYMGEAVKNRIIKAAESRERV